MDLFYIWHDIDPKFYSTLSPPLFMISKFLRSFIYLANFQIMLFIFCIERAAMEDVHPKLYPVHPPPHPLPPPPPHTHTHTHTHTHRGDIYITSRKKINCINTTFNWMLINILKTCIIQHMFKIKLHTHTRTHTHTHTRTCTCTHTLGIVSYSFKFLD